MSKHGGKKRNVSILNTRWHQSARTYRNAIALSHQHTFAQFVELVSGVSLTNRLAMRSGNAAITLRSRLKVKVVKEMLLPQQREQDQEPENNGLVPHRYTSSDAGKVTLQLQVSSFRLPSLKTIQWRLERRVTRFMSFSRSQVAA